MISFRRITNNCIRNISMSVMKYEWKRNLILILAIISTSALLSAMTLNTFFYNNFLERSIKSKYQAGITSINDVKFQILENSGDVELIGKIYLLPTIHNESYSLDISYIDENALSLNNVKLLSGHLPELTDEIAVSSSLLERLNLPDSVEQAITLDLGTGPCQYQLTGIVDTPIQDRKETVIVSREFVNQTVSSDLYYSAYLSFTNSDQKSETELKEFISDFMAEHGIEQQKYFFSSSYFISTSQTLSEKLASVLTAGCIILIACALLIYSLFYTTIVSKIHEYGSFLLAGASEKQLYKIIRMEGRILSILSIPPGLLLGSVIAYLMMPAGWDFSTVLLCNLLIALVLLLVIKLCIRKPARIAVSLPIIETIKLTSMDSGKAGDFHNRKKSYRMSTFSLACLNFSRNRKKTLLTLLALCFTGILLISSATLLASFNIEKAARLAFPDSEITLILNQDSQELNSVPEASIQVNNPFDDTLVDSLTSIPGVTNVRTRQGVFTQVAWPDQDPVDYLMHCTGLDERQGQKLQPYLTEGTIDYQTLVKERGIIINNPNSNLEKWESYHPQIGDKIRFSKTDGTILTLTVLGITAAAHQGVAIDFIYMPVEFLAEINPEVSNFNTYIYIKTDGNDLAGIEENVYRLTAGIPMEFWSYKDSLHIQETGISSLKKVVYFITALIGLFGLINLINTLITSYISRKRDISLLQAVGLTDKQFMKMNVMECFIYFLTIILITLTVGTGTSLVLYNIVNNMDENPLFVYQFPLLPVLLYFFLILIIQFIYIVCINRINNARTIGEKIQLPE